MLADSKCLENHCCIYFVQFFSWFKTGRRVNLVLITTSQLKAKVLGSVLIAWPFTVHAVQQNMLSGFGYLGCPKH